MALAPLLALLGTGAGTGIGAGVAHAEPRAGAESGATSQAARLAERLREKPVYLSDALPRAVPRSAAPAYTEQARRTGVPTYVLVLPEGAMDARGDGLLAAVHDRLGKRGLYVLLDGSGSSVTTAAYGVEVPAEDAGRATQFELPYDAGPLETFTHFVDVLRSGDATERAEAALDSSRTAGNEPEPLHTTRTDRENQSILSGALIAGVPLLLLGVGWYVRRLRGGRGPGLRVLVPVAAGTAVLLAAGAAWRYDDTRSDSDPLPTARDIAARGERVADGLRRTPLYTDPEAAPALSPEEREELARRAAKLDVPVRIAVVPMDPEDESGGDADLFAQRLHKELGEDGVYVVAAPGENDGVHVVNYGAKLDDDRLYEQTEDLRYGPGGEDPEPLHHRLDTVLRAIDRTPAGPPGEPYLPPSPAQDPAEEGELEPLFSADMAGGAALGAAGAAGGLGLTAAGLGIARRAARGPGARPDVAGPDGAPTPDAPARPSLGWLRRTARRELEELGTAFGERGDALPESGRTRVWDCLDTATLLLDQEGDSVIDTDADAATLATGVTLLRAGSAILRESGDARRADAGRAEARRIRHLCALNPLHGPSAGNQTFTWPVEGERASSYPVCAACRAALPGPRDATARDGAARATVLRLAPSWEPYDRAAGPLGARRGITVDQLVSRVREQLGVH
ncbi:hypothetical protein GCM10009801_30170 [Streptomyces albiaxialis]|uniref:TPM domain-containing protein n=1 Tax=Streptomyces albiaxialis TaxID=329523 RepID=A0ABN2VWP1_9ACTN